MHIPVEILARVRALYDRGLNLQAYQTAIAHAPLSDWQDTEARILAGRLAMQLGGQRLGYAYHLRAGRGDRTSLAARYYYARTLLSRKGLLVAWEFVRSSGEFPDASPRELAEWECFRAQLLSHFRDFDAAGEAIERALALDPQNYWLYVTQAWIFEERDLYPEAQAMAERALQLKPYDTAATLTIARMLTLLERDDAALAVLQETIAKTESGAIAHTLAQLQTELGDYVGAQQSYARYAELMPLLEPGGKQWLLSRQADLAYYLGDFATTSQLAAQVESAFYQKIAERLQLQPLVGKRVLLPVGFVRQHRATCAPATLATLTRFWDKPTDHLDIAAEICYDGTAPDRERLWAEQNGWIATEFTITWESAVALIDRGIPFTLTTTEPTSAHLQAVIGYDSYLQQLLIRDPYNRQIGEAWGPEFLAHYAAFGPRGMVLVPQDKSDLLTDLDLPDADLYTRSYQIQGALARNRRETASQIYQQMVQIAPSHRLTIDAERSIASYDGDETRVLAAIEKSLLQFPDCANLILGKLSCLQELARREERLEILTEMCAKNDHPVFLQYYAQEIGDDGRAADVAIAVLRRTIRQMPTSAQNYYALARILWLQREYTVAFELYRFATCLEDKKSTYAKTYFLTARHRKQTKAALQLLEQRWHRLGTKSAEPLLTLFWAYSQLNRMTEAFALLDGAIADLAGRDLSQQNDLLIGAANAYAEYGRYQQAESILDRIRETISPATWRRIAAELAAKQGDIVGSLGHWQAILSIEPLAIDVNRAIANLLAETQGITAALDFLKTACDRFPHSYSLHQLWSGWLLEADDLVATEEVLRRMIEIDASDAWTRRQLARVLGNQRQLTAAAIEIDLARELEPHSPYERVLRGYLSELAGENAAAKTAYKEAIALSIDSEGAMGALLSLCYTHEERTAALEFCFNELKQQIVMGDGLINYQAQAVNILAPETLLAQMREAWTERPDLWQARSALVLQLLQFDCLDEALTIAQQFTEQFPLMPKAWLDLSTVYRQQEDNDNEAIALNRSLAIDPTWNIPIGRLSRVYERTEQYELGKQLLETAILREPRDLSHHCHLAELLWKIADRDAALARLKIVVQTTSGGHNYAWAWEKLKEWSIACERPEFAAGLVRELTHNYPGAARSWYFLADTLESDEDRPECLTALDRAIELDPYYIDAYDLKARLLVRADEHEAALAVCNTTAWNEDRPISLRARAAWVEQQRGRHQNAFDLFSEIVAIEPDFEWAWLQLTQYFDRLDNLAEYLPAAQKLVHLDPQDPVNWGYLGDAYNRTGDISQAQAAWEKSLEIAPHYDYGGISLFELHLQAGNFDPATTLLAQIKPHLDPDVYLPAQIRVSIHHGDYPTAEADLAQLCQCDLEHDRGLRVAIAAIKSAGLAKNVEKILFDRLSTQEVSSFVRLLWLESAAELEYWQKIDRYIQSVDFQTDFSLEVARTYIELLGKYRQSKILNKFIFKYEKVLRPEISLWGAVGFALRLNRSDRELINWCWDWPQRKNAEPWMLGNLNEALRAVGSDVKARYVNQCALKLPTTSGQHYHLAWIAFDLASMGKIDEAGEYLQEILPSDRHNPEYQFLLEITQALVVAQAIMGSSKVKLKLIRRHFATARSAYPEFIKDKSFARVYHHARQLRYSIFDLSLTGELLRDLWHSSEIFSAFKRIFGN